MRAKLVSIFVLVLLLPLVPSSLDPLPAVEAASNCGGEIPSVRWNETVSRVAITPSTANWYYSNDWDMDQNNRRGDGFEESPPAPDISQETSAEEPEELWMRNNDFWTLEPLEDNVRATMLVGNNSVGAYVVNLSASHRSTICVSLQGLNNGNYSAVKGDVYLLTSTEWDRYTSTYYQSMDGNDWWENSLADLPPEWRSFDVLGWDTFRDAHQYESIDEVTFSISLDGPEVYSNLWGDSQWEQFYIVVDTWDNDHSNDAPPPSMVTVADVTIIVEERGTVLPNWTVSLTCMSTMIAVLITPFVMNRKYMGAGLEVNHAGDTAKLMPSLVQEKN